MKISKPYLNMEQNTKIVLLPSQMNSDILINLKLNLKEKVEKKCNNYGYIEKVHKISKFDDGRMDGENLSGSAIYDVDFLCKIYLANENTNIVGDVILISQDLIVIDNGPLKIFVNRSSVNTDNFNLEKNYTHIKSKEELKLNQKVIVKIVKKRLNKNDRYINCVGYLIDIASPSQIKEYYDEEDKGESNFIDL